MLTDNKKVKDLKTENNNSNKKSIKGMIILLFVAMIWGASFVSQRAGADVLQVNSFNGIRMLIGGIALLPVCFIISRIDKINGGKSKNDKDIKTERKNLLKVGVLCGVVLCIASTVQTYGIKFTTAGKSGFITAMYIIFVPVMSIAIGKKIGAKTIVAALIAIFGMYLLSIKGSEGGINKGDLITLLCAVFFAIHIMIVDKYALDINPIYFSSIQFITCGIINIVLALIFETLTLDMIRAAIVPILYSGLLSCGVAYTLQPLGQRYAEASSASILMSLESVFAMIFGAILLPNNMPNITEIIGCIIMFGAIVLGQMPDKKVI